MPKKAAPKATSKAKTKTETTPTAPDFTLKKQNMLEALEKSLGIVTTASQKANISRQLHYEWMRNDPEYAKAVKDIDELMLDLAESKLFQAVNNGELTAIFFFLKCKGKRRGYIEKGEALEENNKDFVDMRPKRLAESDADTL